MSAKQLTDPHGNVKILSIAGFKAVLQQGVLRGFVGLMKPQGVKPSLDKCCFGRIEIDNGCGMGCFLAVYVLCTCSDKVVVVVQIPKELVVGLLLAGHG